MEHLKEFWEEAREIVRGKDSVYVNCYIAAALCDDYFSFSPKTSVEKDTVYLIGLYCDTKLYVDSYMKYSDHRMLNENGECLIDFKIKYGDIPLI